MYCMTLLLFVFGFDSTLKGRSGQNDWQHVVPEQVEDLQAGFIPFFHCFRILAICLIHFNNRELQMASFGTIISC